MTLNALIEQLIQIRLDLGFKEVHVEIMESDGTQLPIDKVKLRGGKVVIE